MLSVKKFPALSSGLHNSGKLIAGLGAHSGRPPARQPDFARTNHGHGSVGDLSSTSCLGSAAPPGWN